MQNWRKFHKLFSENVLGKSGEKGGASIPFSQNVKGWPESATKRHSPRNEAVSQFVIPAKPRETGREPGSRSPRDDAISLDSGSRYAARRSPGMTGLFITTQSLKIGGWEWRNNLAALGCRTLAYQPSNSANLGATFGNFAFCSASSFE